MEQTTKEKIIFATLELASKKGLSNTSLNDIANLAGIKKASLYNHFTSREDLILSLYAYFKTLATAKSLSIEHFLEAQKNTSALDILRMVTAAYIKSNSAGVTGQFFRIIESERLYNKEAAKVIVQETNKAFATSYELLELLNAEGKLHIDDLQTAATIFSLTVHELMGLCYMHSSGSEEEAHWLKKLDDFIQGFTLLYS